MLLVGLLLMVYAAVCTWYVPRSRAVWVDPQGYVRAHPQRVLGRVRAWTIASYVLLGLIGLVLLLAVLQYFVNFLSAIWY